MEIKNDEVAYEIQILSTPPKVSSLLDTLTNGLRTLRKVRHCCRELNIQRIRIHITNLVWSSMIYVVKVAAFLCIVVATFGAAKFFGMNIDTLGGVVISVNVLMLWIISTGHAYRVPEYMDQVRGNLRSARVQLALTWPHQMTEWRAIEAELRAMRPLGFQEGEFRYLHKESALEFMDFYVSRVIGLMLAFP